jgi:hypothetical protein
MTLQNKIIQRYRLFYPQETLREASERTGIQITRVFRLFNGKTMKVSELEAFESAINKKVAESPQYSRLNNIVEEALSIFTNEELSKVADHIERRVANKKYSRTYIRPLFEDASIA